MQAYFARDGPSGYDGRLTLKKLPDARTKKGKKALEEYATMGDKTTQKAVQPKV
jgi:hypothetical protein